jgi:hypothetical protein
MKSFREWLREAKINESPENLYDMNGLQSKEDFKEKIKDNFRKISDREKLKAKKLFSAFKYIIKDNTFYVFREIGVLDLFITFTKENKTFNVKVIRNLSDERNLSFKVYRAILDLSEFSEIVTGDALTLNNISAHKKALSVLSAFKLYIRTKDGDTRIQDEYDINYYMKRDKPNEVFVLKESAQLRYIRENFNSNLDKTLDEYIDFCFNDLDVETLTEVQRTGAQERDDFSGEKEKNGID